MADATAGGIGAGLLAFSDSYNKAKQQDRTNDLNQQYVNIAKQRQSADLLDKGMVLDENGNPSYDDIHKKMKDLESQNYVSDQQRKLDANTPGSGLKSPVGVFYKNVMNSFSSPKQNPDGTQSPGLGDQIISPDTKLSDLDKLDAPVQSMFKGMETEKQQAAHWQTLKDISELNNNAKDKMNQDKSDLTKQIQDMKNSSSADKNEVLKQLQELKNKGALDKQGLINSGKSAKPNPAYQSLDKDFAKDWNTYTSGGRASVDKNLDQLEQAKQYLQENPDATGAAKGLIPDKIRAFTNPDVLNMKQQVQGAVIGGMKGAMGGRVTQNEMNTFMKLAWDDQLPAKDNINRIDQVINKIKTERENTEQKGAQFEKNGTLQGMQQSQPTGYTPKQQKGLVQPNQSSQVQANQPNTVRIMAPNGKIKIIPSDQKDAAIKAGGKLVQ